MKARIFKNFWTAKNKFLASLATQNFFKRDLGLESKGSEHLGFNGKSAKGVV